MTIGEFAYDAWAEDFSGGSDTPSWDNLTAATKLQWEGYAFRVRSYNGSEPIGQYAYEQWASTFGDSNTPPWSAVDQTAWGTYADEVVTFEPPGGGGPP